MAAQLAVDPAANDGFSAEVQIVRVGELHLEVGSWRELVEVVEGPEVGLLRERGAAHLEGVKGFQGTGGEHNGGEVWRAGEQSLPH
jgi:hypothetical protein